MSQDDAILRLARQIDRTLRAEQFLASSDDVAAIRRSGALELHAICSDFVSSVNRRLSEARLELSPADYSAESFRASGVNLLQIASQGRQMQLTFEAPAQLVSTEKFLIPYVLDGEIRTYNQRMLEHFDVRSLLIFFCLEDARAYWRFFDWRTRRTGPIDRDLLAGLMEPLFE